METTPAHDTTGLRVMVRHAAPVRTRPRANAREALSFDPMTTPVTVPCVAPGAMDPRRVPLGEGNHLDGFVHDGRLWRALAASDGEGGEREAVPGDLGRLVSGADGLHRNPFWPRDLDATVLAASRAREPLAPRIVSGAIEALHGLAAEKARQVARHGMAHDGTRVYLALPAPLLIMNGSEAILSTREGGDWLPLHGHDRRDDARAIARVIYGLDDEATAAWGAGQRLADDIAGAIPEVRSDLGEVRALANRMPGRFLRLWPGLGGRTRVTEEVGERLGALAARASIDAIGEVELPAAVATIAEAARMLNDWHAVRHVRGRSQRVMEFCVAVAIPRLADGPVPEDDVSSLAGLTP
jgi:hypothetical protein